MATKKVFHPIFTTLPDTQAEKLRKKVWHLLVDLNLTATGTPEKLAAVLSQRMGEPVSRTTLAMTLSGYRTTTKYITYLRELKKHLHNCKKNQTDPLAGAKPVTLYTTEPNNQAQNERSHNEK